MAWRWAYFHFWVNYCFKKHPMTLIAFSFSGSPERPQESDTQRAQWRWDTCRPRPELATSFTSAVLGTAKYNRLCMWCCISQNERSQLCRPGHQALALHKLFQVCCIFRKLRILTAQGRYSRAESFTMSWLWHHLYLGHDRKNDSYIWRSQSNLKRFLGRIF